MIEAVMFWNAVTQGCRDERLVERTSLPACVGLLLRSAEYGAITCFRMLYSPTRR